MFCAPDVLGWTRMAHQLEARWRAEAECRADALAVAGDAARAIDLASALVKVARLAQQPSGRFASPMWSTFHEGAPLEARVHRLMSLPDAPTCEPVLSGRVLALAVALPLVLWLSGVPYYLHRATEFLVAVLP
jgi:hypothetical protein